MTLNGAQIHSAAVVSYHTGEARRTTANPIQSHSEPIKCRLYPALSRQIKKFAGLLRFVPTPMFIKGGVPSPPPASKQLELHLTRTPDPTLACASNPVKRHSYATLFAYLIHFENASLPTAPKPYLLVEGRASGRVWTCHFLRAGPWPIHQESPGRLDLGHQA